MDSPGSSWGTISRRGLPYAIIDANDRIGDAWRNRWDSLRLFTPNRLNGLPGMPFPGGYHWGFPSKDEMADYLESYARRFDIRVETGVRVERLSREGDRFVATAGNRRFEADNVVVAMSSWQKPRIPEFASELDPSIVQLHVAEYRNPGQLQEGGVLGRSGQPGAEVANELARTHDVWLSGPDTGNLPFRPESVAARVLMPFIGRIIFHRVLTTSTPIGRKARPKMVSTGEPLIRVKQKTWQQRAWNVFPGSPGSSTDSPNSKTAVVSMLPTWSGAPDSIQGSPGSISRYSAPKGRFSTVASSSPSPGSIFWASSSSTRSHQSRSMVWDEMLLHRRCDCGSAWEKSP